MRILLLFLTVFAMPAHALDSAALAQQVSRAGTLKPLFEAIDTRGLAADAGGGDRLAEMLAAVREQLQGGNIADAAFAGEAAGQTLRLRFAGGRLNYLSLSMDGRGRLAGWYDYALGVHLHELVTALARLDPEEAGTLLERLDEAPGELVDHFPADRALSRLVLAACAGRGCYRAALAAQRPMEPARASLWRYEQAVMAGDRSARERAMGALREELGEDPGLAWLTAATAVGDGDCEAAYRGAHGAVERWPDYRPLYDIVAQCAVRLGRHDQATHWFRQLEERFGERVDLEALRQRPSYRDYLESESFRHWRNGD